MAETEEFDLEKELEQLGISTKGEAEERETPSEAPVQLGPEEIGRVAISDELFVSTGDHLIEVYLPEERRNEVAVGQYVVIPLEYREEKLFGHVSKLSYRKRDALDDMSEVHVLLSAESVGEGEYIELARVEPIAVIGADGAPSEVRHIPKPNARVRRVTSREEVIVGLDLPEEGLFLGYVAVGGEEVTFQGRFKVPYYLVNAPDKTGDPLIFTHVLIAGMSGRGKTHVAKNFLRQIVGSRYPLERRGGERRAPCIVIVDPENEYWGLKDDPDPAKAPPEADVEELLSVKGAYGGVGRRLTVFSAVEEGASYRGASAHTDFTIPFELVNDFPVLIAGGEMNEAQYETLVQLIRVFFRKEGDKTYRAFKGFVERLLDDEEALATERGLKAVHPETLKAIYRRIRPAHFGKVFDQGANPITELIESIFDEDRVSVFPTDHLSAEGERVVVLAVMSMIADAKTKAVAKPWGRRIARYPVILAVDEAHSYLTQGGTQQDRVINEKFVAAAKQGRKERLGLVLITQNPQDVSEAVLSQVSTRILLGMEEGVAERAGAPKAYRKALPYFERGRMVVHSPDNSHPLEIRGLPFCVVRH